MYEFILLLAFAARRCCRFNPITQPKNPQPEEESLRKDMADSIMEKADAVTGDDMVLMSMGKVSEMERVFNVWTCTSFFPPKMGLRLTARSDRISGHVHVQLVLFYCPILNNLRPRGLGRLTLWDVSGTYRLLRILCDRAMAETIDVQARGSCGTNAPHDVRCRVLFNLACGRRTTVLCSSRRNPKVAPFNVLHCRLGSHHCGNLNWGVMCTQ